ncbi:MAG TPA: hypothetical protein VHE35_15715 [Kofleriaceae bacterium]|nr:hypothetical protein [Kofleriaceae bacterium]
MGRARVVKLVLSVVMVVAGLGAGGCKGKPGRKAPIVDQSQEQALIARRDALLRNRQDLEAEKDKLAAERQKVVSEGGDTAELDRKALDLKTREDALSGEESQIVGQLLDERQALLNAVQSGNDASARATFREEAAASREKAVATREDKVAAREAAIALREKQLAERERETCGAAPPPTTIIQTVDAKGSKYAKKDVEPLLTKTRSVMGSRGILAGDLPAPVRDLEKEATDAMADADFGRAYLAAQQLWRTVSTLAIDRPFIQAKSARLSALVKSKRLEAALQQQVDGWFSDATSQFVDGDYKGANRKLNQIWAALQ